jgi:hypothetical protein
MKRGRADILERFVGHPPDTFLKADPGADRLELPWTSEWSPRLATELRPILHSSRAPTCSSRARQKQAGPGRRGLPSAGPIDLIFVGLYRLFPDVRAALAIVKPDTVMLAS